MNPARQKGLSWNFQSSRRGRGGKLERRVKGSTGEQSLNQGIKGRLTAGLDDNQISMIPNRQKNVKDGG